MNPAEHERYLVARNFLAETTPTVAHSGRTLFDHLVGTHLLLKVYREREAVCLAGLFHSIYDKHSALSADSTEDREVVGKMIGPEAEELVHAFCALPDRPRCFFERPHNGRTLLLDRLWRDLRAIELANLLEQGGFSAIINWM